MNKKLIGALVIFCLLLPQTAAAHVLIRDDSQQIGAILHIVPDDDPIAGEQSELYFDIQGQVQTKNYVATLQITDDSDRIATVPVTIDGSSANAIYTFPSQGTYQLELTIDSGSNSYTFTHAQRVTRGATLTPLSQPTHAWAEIALVASISSFFLLLVIGLNHRKEIAKHSKF